MDINTYRNIIGTFRPDGRQKILYKSKITKPNHSLMMKRRTILICLTLLLQIMLPTGWTVSNLNDGKNNSAKNSNDYSTAQHSTVQYRNTENTTVQYNMCKVDSTVQYNTVQRLESLSIENCRMSGRVQITVRKKW